MTTTDFHPIILVSPVTLPRFLEGTEEVAAIIKAGQNPSSPRLLSDHWNVVCLNEVKEVFHLCYSLVLKSLSLLFDGLCMSDLSKRTWVMSCHELTEGTLFKTQQVFQDKFLARSINTYRKDIADFYLQEPLQYSLPGQSRVFNLKFFNSKGVCKGMCHWFVSLYFKTQNLFIDTQEHLRALGTQFEQGASRQAAFLQPTIPSDFLYNLLHMNCHLDFLKIDPRDKTHEQIIQEIQSCPPGVYGIYAANHQFVYIKSDNGQQFLFDPNKGVLKVDSLFLFKYAISRYLVRHDSSQNIIIDQYSYQP